MSRRGTILALMAAATLFGGAALAANTFDPAPDASTAIPAPVPGSVTSPAGTAVPPDTGVPQPATTSTSGGAHP